MRSVKVELTEDQFRFLEARVEKIKTLRGLGNKKASVTMANVVAGLIEFWRSIEQKDITVPGRESTGTEP